MGVLNTRMLVYIAVTCGACLIAYRHGQMSAGGAECQCGRVSPAALRNQEEELESTPATEERMIKCILETVGVRSALRKRLYTCLDERGHLDPASAAMMLSPSPSPPPLILSAGAALPDASDEPPKALVMQPAASASPPPPSDPLLASLQSAKEVEDMLPSAPLAPARVATAASGGEWLTDAASAAQHARLVTISCLANGRLLSLEASTGWAQCAIDAASPSASELREAVFVQQTRGPSMQLAFRHLQTGRYLQVVAPRTQGPAWVVRASATTIGQDELWEVRSGRGGHTFLYHVATGAHLNHRFGFTVRGHGDKPGIPAGRVPSARVDMRYYTSTELRAAHEAASARQQASRAPVRAQLSRIHSLAVTRENRVISYGLYGSNTRYTVGVLRNAQLAPLVYPGWKVRVYLDHTVPANIVQQLVRLDAQIVRMDDKQMGGGIGGMFWRFLVAADPDVDRYIVRDSDSRLNTRERLAVEEWIASGKRIHSLRDHPNHDRPLNGGMWGGVKGAVSDMATIVRQWSNRDAYMGDLDFLNQVVWARQTVKESQISHDAYSCQKYPNAHPFPTARPPDFQHVGQVFFGDGRPRQGDITDFMLNRQAPRQCRGDPSWVHG